MLENNQSVNIDTRDSTFLKLTRSSVFNEKSSRAFSVSVKLRAWKIKYNFKNVTRSNRIDLKKSRNHSQLLIYRRLLYIYSKTVKSLRQRGIEPRSKAWEASMLTITPLTRARHVHRRKNWPTRILIVPRRAQTSCDQFVRVSLNLPC